MDRKKKIEQLLKAANRMQGPKSEAPPHVQGRRMTQEEFDDFICGKPTIIRIITPRETAYSLYELIDGKLVETRIGSDESDLNSIAERISNWVRPEGFNCLCPSSWNSYLKSRGVKNL